MVAPSNIFLHLNVVFQSSHVLANRNLFYSYQYKSEYECPFLILRQPLGIGGCFAKEAAQGREFKDVGVVT